MGGRSMTQTIDIGRIAVNPSGDYDAANTYNKLDLVYHNGSTWMAKRDNITGIEPGDTSSIGATIASLVAWQKTAAGSELGSTLPDEGDMLVNDGANLSALPIGTAGQLLTVNAAGTQPEWQDRAGGTKVKLHRHRWTSAQAVSAGGTMLTGSYFTITPASQNSHFQITYDHMMNHTYGQEIWLWVDFNDGVGWREISTATTKDNNYAIYQIAYSTVTKSDVCKLDDLNAPTSVLTTGITFGMMAAGHSTGGTSNYQSGRFSSGYSFVETWEE
jgi:hypothetical protein